MKKLFLKFLRFKFTELIILFLIFTAIIELVLHYTNLIYKSITYNVLKRKIIQQLDLDEYDYSEVTVFRGKDGKLEFRSAYGVSVLLDG